MTAEEWHVFECNTCGEEIDCDCSDPKCGDDDDFEGRPCGECWEAS